MRPGLRHSPGPGRVPALDGLRGIAVLAVLAFHAWPLLLPGGFVGVDMFFVLSGFLITTGLVRRIDAGQGVGFRQFWTKRLRRLVPALIVVLVACTALAWLAAHEFPAGLRREWLGALTYTSNWLMIVEGNDYFNQATPPMFEHLWSLAIEEQFYVLWPPLILGLLLLLRPRTRTQDIADAGRRADRIRVAVVLALAVASAVWMAVLTLQGHPQTRMYFGTDSHAFGLLFGAAVALGVAHRPRPAGLPTTSPTPVRTGAAWLGLGVVLVGFVLVDGTEDYVYLGVLAGLSGVVALLIWHATAGTRTDSFSRAMSARWLAWWGHRSYAAYLWHWPLLVLMRVLLPVDAPGWAEPVAAAGVLLLTALLADLSTRLLEQAILRDGFRATFARWRAGIGRAWRGGATTSQEAGALAGTPASAARTVGSRVAVTGAALALVATTGAAAGALVVSPAQTQLQRDIAEAEEALRRAEEAQAEAVAPGSAATPNDDGAESGQDGAGAAEASPGVGGADGVADDDAGPEPGPDEDAGSSAAPGTPPAEDPGPTAPAQPAEGPAYAPIFTEDQLTAVLPPSTRGSQISVIGDSVGLASASKMLEQMPGIAVDAEVGTQMRDATEILTTKANEGRLRDVVVLALGTNGGAAASEWDEILDAVGPDRLLVLVTPYADRDWVPGVQQRMRALAAEHPDRVVVADWAQAAQYAKEWDPDGIHPRKESRDLYAQLIRLTVEWRLGAE